MAIIQTRQPTHASTATILVVLATDLMPTTALSAKTLTMKKTDSAKHPALRANLSSTELAKDATPSAKPALESLTRNATFAHQDSSISISNALQSAPTDTTLI